MDAQWTWMAERLPEPEIDVLVYWFNHHTKIGYQEVMDRGGPAWNGIEQRAHLELVAWTSLPEPPQIKNGGNDMACYRSGGCGPYEQLSCSECPASKPSFLDMSGVKPAEKMSKGEAYRVVGKHVFKAYRTYGDPEDTVLIILADTLEDAKAKAKERWDSPFITVRAVTPTKDPQIYEV